MLNNLFQSESRVAIISLFLMTEFKGSIRGVAKQVMCSPMQARYELANLEKMGVLKSELVGNAKIYSLDEKCPFLDELRALFVKVAGFELQLKDALRKIKGIRAAFIYGSYANGSFNASSDIDLFVIGTPDMVKLNSAIFALQKKLGREIQLATYSPKDFAKRKSSGFVKNVLANKRIMVIGEKSELG